MVEALPLTLATASADCPCCGHRRFFTVLELPATPPSGVLRLSADVALKIREMVFEACANCGLLRNRDFALPLDYSEKPRPTARQLPSYESYLLGLVGETLTKDELILEIGSNDGSFLDLLRAAGYSNIFGIEPSSELARLSGEKGHRILAEYFGPDMVGTLLTLYGAPKMVICRHTLEHVPNLGKFVQALRALLGPGRGTALIEVPDSTAIPEGLNFVELWDEHLFYFTSTTLRLLMQRNKLRVASEMVFPHLDTRNIMVCVTLEEDSVHCAELGTRSNEAAMWEIFSDRFQTMAEQIRSAVLAAEKPVYVIGASHPQCNFVNYLRIEQSVDFMIDDDSAKIGKLPPIRSNSVRVISSDEFLRKPDGGTLLLTGFGYADWTRQLSEVALAKGLVLIDPYDFVPQVSS